MPFLLRLRSMFRELVAAAMVLGGCKHAPSNPPHEQHADAREAQTGSCTAGDGLILIFEPKVGTPTSVAPAMAQALGNDARVIASDRVLVVVVTDRAAEKAWAVHQKAFAVAHSANLEPTIEDTGTIDARCTVRRVHDPTPIAPAP